MSEAVGRARIVIDADTSKFEGQLGGVKGSLDGLKNHLSGLATGLVATAGAFVTATLLGGVKRFTTIEDATVSLTITLGSAAKAAAFVGETLKVVQGTPFNLDQFLQTGKNLVAQGVKVNQVLGPKGLLRALGEVAAASGKGAEAVDQISRALGSAAAAGKITGETVNQLAGAGVPALAILANGFGVTRDKMRAMISDGIVPAGKAFDILRLGIIDGSNGAAGAVIGLGGTMDKLRNTVSGAAGGIKASMDRLGAAIFSGVATGTNAVSPLVLILQSIATTIDAVTVRVKAALEKVSNSPALNAIVGFFQKLPGLVSGVNPALSGLAGVLGPLTGAFAALGLTGLGGLLGPLGALLPEISPLTGALIGLLATSKPLQAIFGQILTTIFTTLKGVLTALAPVFQALAPLIEKVALVIGGALLKVITAIAPSLLVFAKTLGPVISKAITDLTPSIVLLADALATGLTKVIIAITPILLKLALALIPLIRPVAELIAAFVTGLVPIIKELTPIIIKLATLFAGQMLESAKTLIPPIIALIGAITPMIDVFMQVVSWGIKIAKFFAKLGGDIVDGLISGIKKGVTAVKIALLSLIPAPLRGALAHLFGKSPSPMFTEFGRQLVDGLVKGIESQRSTLAATLNSLAPSSFAVPAFAGAAGGLAAGGRSFGSNPIAAAVGVQRTISQSITVNEVAQDPRATAEAVAMRIGRKVFG